MPDRYFTFGTILIIYANMSKRNSCNQVNPLVGMSHELVLISLPTTLETLPVISSICIQVMNKATFWITHFRVMLGGNVKSFVKWELFDIFIKSELTVVSKFYSIKSLGDFTFGLNLLMYKNQTPFFSSLTLNRTSSKYCSVLFNLLVIELLPSWLYW